MIKGIIFDFDGTLSLRAKSVYYIYRSILKRLFPELPEDSPEFEAKVQRCILWDQFGSVHKSEVYNHIKDEWLPDLDVKKLSDEWYRNPVECIYPVPGIYETLEKLKEHYKLAILTNGIHEHQMAKVEALHVESYFDVVLTTGSLGVNKPDPLPFLKTAEMLGLKPEEIAVIGDTFETDILGACRAGMKPVWLGYEHYSITDLDIVCVKNYDEIEELFLRNTEWNV